MSATRLLQFRLAHGTRLPNSLRSLSLRILIDWKEKKPSTEGEIPKILIRIKKTNQWMWRVKHEPRFMYLVNLSMTNFKVVKISLHMFFHVGSFSMVNIYSSFKKEVICVKSGYSTSIISRSFERWIHVPKSCTILLPDIIVFFKLIILSACCFSN